MKNDLTGQIFGRLTALRWARAGYWECRCSCGNLKTIASDKLRSGHTKSCGCLRTEQLALRSTKHGHAKRGGKIPEYSVWHNMRRRCNDPSNNAYTNYGGRGITVCAEWYNSFEQFYKDMGPRPTAKHTIERVDNEAGYNPTNCVWATRAEQDKNKRPRKNGWYIDGVPLKQVAKEKGIRYETALYRYKKHGRID